MPLKDGNQLARMTDATIITTLCSKNDVDELIAACKKYNFYGTIGPRCWLPYMVEALKGYDTVLLSSSGAINGADNVPIKVFGSKWNLEQGADEVENTINFSYFKSGMYKEVVEDIRAVREAIGPVSDTHLSRQIYEWTVNTRSGCGTLGLSFDNKK